MEALPINYFFYIPLFSEHPMIELGWTSFAISLTFSIDFPVDSLRPKRKLASY